MIDDSGDCKDNDSCNVVGYEQLPGLLLHEGKKVCFGGEEISAQKKKERNVKSVYETVCACDSEVACNDTEHGKPFCDINIAKGFLCGFAIAFGGQGGGDSCSRCRQALCLS